MYLFKSRRDLLGENKPIVYLMMTVEVNYIKDAHNNGKNHFDISPKKFLNWTKTSKIWGKMLNI